MGDTPTRTPGFFPLGDGNLYRANLDGSDAHWVVERGGPTAFDIAVDPDNERVYCSVLGHHYPYDRPWTEFEGIISVSFDGTEHLQVLWPLEEVDPHGPNGRLFEFTLDPESDVLYWSFFDQIGRMDLASMDTTMFAYGEPGWQRKGLVLDSESGDLYWASRGDQSEDAARITPHRAGTRRRVRLRDDCRPRGRRHRRHGCRAIGKRHLRRTRCRSTDKTLAPPCISLPVQRIGDTVLFALKANARPYRRLERVGTDRSHAD